MTNVKAQKKDVFNEKGEKVGSIVVYPNMVEAAKKQNKKGSTFFKRGFVTGLLIGTLVAGGAGFMAYN